MSPARIGMVAGESSGDLLAADVLAAMGRLAPGEATVATGIGGPLMVAQRFEAWWDAEHLAVHGYAAALKVLPKLLYIRRRLGTRLLDWPAEVFVGVDAPDFNLGLERRLRAGGVRTLHFVSPSVWAWRRERLDGIREAVDRMLLVFPFEEAIYRDAGIPARYCGHPLADRIALVPDRAQARRDLTIPGDRPLVAVLPGSRRGEVARLGPLFIETIRWIARQRPDWRFAIPAAGAERFAQLRQLLAGARLDATVQLVLGQSHAVLAACDAAIVASGTATLEAALFKRPMVIAYRLGGLDYRRMKSQAYLPWVGLPNILAGEFVVPEFIQDAARPEAIGAALIASLEDTAATDRLAARFEAMHRELRRDCAQQVGSAILEAASREGGR